MIKRSKNALDSVLNFVYSTFKKVLWTVLIAAVMASIITALLIYLGSQIVS